MKSKSMLTTAIITLALGAGLGLRTLSFAADDKTPAPAATQTIKGEVVDLMCYLDHGAKGEKHKGCAARCIKGGGPIGLLTSEDQLYLVVGDHAPLNETLSAKAGETVSLKGKVVERSGMKMIEGAEVVEK
jgi:hypothetical protein